MPGEVALATLGDSAELEWIPPGITSVVSESRRPGELLGRFFDQLEQLHRDGALSAEAAGQDPTWSGEAHELPARVAVRASTVGVTSLPGPLSIAMESGDVVGALNIGPGMASR
jgi:hypothetical protein